MGPSATDAKVTLMAQSAIVPQVQVADAAESRLWTSRGL